MMTVEFITALFYEVDEQLRAIPKHPEAYLWPSEVVTLGIFEFIPITPWAATGSNVPGSCAGHSRVPSPDHGPLASIGGSGPSRCGSA